MRCLASLRTTLSSLCRTPGFTLAALASLALGIGLNTGTYQLTHRMVKGDCTVDREGLVLLHATEADRRWVSLSLSAPDLADLARDVPALEHVCPIAWDAPLWEREGSTPERLQATRVGTPFFALVKTPPALGRPFQPEDGRPGAAPVVILSHRLWQTSFGGRPDILGTRLRLDGEMAEVVGVMPPGFSTGRLGGERTLLRPWQASATALALRESGLAMAGARLRAGTPPASLNAQLERLGHALSPLHTREEGRWRLAFQPAVYPTAWWEALLPMLIPGAVLLVACANVSSLLLARGLARQREEALRAALGATPGQLMATPLMEAGLLAGGGALLGLGIAWGTLRLSAATLPPVPQLDNLRLDASLVGTALVVALVAMVACALLPLLRTRVLDLVAALKSSGTGSLGQAKGLKARRLLVAFQVGVATLLLGVCGLVLSHVRGALTRNPGLAVERAALATVQLPPHRLGAAARHTFRTDLEAGLRARPEVASFVLTQGDPFAPNHALEDVRAEGSAGVGMGRCFTTPAGPGWPATFRVPLRAGRDFEPREQGVCLVNEAFVRQLGWTPAQALGARLHRAFHPEGAVVVGVLADHLREKNPGPIPEVVASMDADPGAFLSIWAGTRGDSQALASSLQGLLRGLSPALILEDLRPVEALRLAYHRDDLSLAALVGACGLLGLGLAALGLNSIVAYLAALQAKDWAVRGALGLTPFRMGLALCLDGGRLVLWGLLPGLGGTLLVGHVLSRQLPGLRPTDPLALLLTVLVLGLAGLLASLGTALRLARTQPGTVLKAE